MSTGYSGKEGYVVDPLEIIAAYSAPLPMGEDSSNPFR